MARLDDIDLDIKNAVLRANATDREEITRILNYLYKLSGKLKWWQTKLDRGNLTEEERKVYEGLFTEIEKIRKELAEKAGKETATESSDGLMSAADKKKLDELEVGARNLLLNSDNPAIHASGSSTYTVTKNISVSAWNASNAIKVAGTGGTSNNVFYVGGVSADIAYNSAISVSGRKYAFGVFVKNNHATKYIGVRVSPLGATSIFWIAPGQSKFISETSVGNGSSVLQIVFRVESIGDPFDITFWHPMIEHGTMVTDWTPAVEEYAGEASVTFNSIRNTGNTTEGTGILRKVGKTVCLKFNTTIKNALAANTWLSIGTLPTGYRPTEGYSFIACTTGNDTTFMRAYLWDNDGNIGIKTPVAFSAGMQISGSVTYFVA